MNIFQAVQNLLVGDTQTDRQIGDLISLLSFLGSRLTIRPQLTDTIYTANNLIKTAN
jgi:hypothetical protein